MIITGLRTTSSVIGEGMFVCPVCKVPESYLHFVLTRWFTFFFIPLFPIRRLGEHVECQNCRSRFEPAVVQAATSDEVVIAALVDQYGIAEPEIISESNSAPAAHRPTLAVAAQNSPLATASLILGLL